MISLYSGTPGSGKSLHCASKILSCLRLHRYVVANFDIEPYNKRTRRMYDTHYIYLANDELEPSILQTFARNVAWCDGKKRNKEDSLLLVIDEAQLLFNAREWAQNHRKEWISFFTQHRKFGFEVILIAQFDEMLDKQIRHLIEYEFIHRKASNFGWRGYLLMALLASPNLFLWIQIWYPMQQKVDQSFFRFHLRYARIYDSYKEFEIGTAQDGGTAARIRAERETRTGTADGSAPLEFLQL